MKALRGAGEVVTIVCAVRGAMFSKAVTTLQRQFVCVCVACECVCVRVPGSFEVAELERAREGQAGTLGREVRALLSARGERDENKCC